MTERSPRTASYGAAEQRPSSVLELVGSDRAMSTVLSFLGPALPTMKSILNPDKGQFSGGRLREALALGRVLPGVCVANPIKVGPAGAALLATDVCLGGLRLARGSSRQHIFAALKLNTGLRKLELWKKGITGNVELFCGALTVNVSLVDVDVSYSAFDRAGARGMAAVLGTTTSLQKLNLHYCNLRPGDVAVLAGALAANASLRELHLGDNNVGEAGGRALGAALETNSTLHVLRLVNTRFSDAGGRAIGAALATNTGLFQLDLGENELGEASGRAMAAALATNTTLRNLDLSSNVDVGGSGAVALFGALRSNHTLLELDMTSTGVDHASGVALADMVRANSTLQVLDLSENRLGRAVDGSGICSWAQVLAALKDNTGLHTLSLAGCGLSADDGQVLARALDQRRSGLLRKLKLSGNFRIGDTFCSAIIAACLKPGSSVASLGRLAEFGASQEALHSLVEGLRQDNKLEVLDLSGIGLRVGVSASWPGLFAALAVNTRVHTLVLYACGLTAGDGQALANALERRPAGLLRELDVNMNRCLGDDACSAIIVACLKPGSALRGLYMDSSGAGLAATVSLADCLRANHTLEELVLGETDAASNWSELFGALAVNSGLRCLKILNCGLKQRDVEALAAALQTNRVLQNLRLDDDDLGDKWGQIMAGGLATNMTLRMLALCDGSRLGGAAAHAFHRLFQTNFNDAATKALMQAGRAKGCHISYPSMHIHPSNQSS